MKLHRYLCFLSLIGLLVYQPCVAKCVGRFVNPITDICWKCVFPLTVGGKKVSSGNPDTPPAGNLIHFCPKPPLNQPTPCIPVGFWEPARLVDVTRTPYCLVSMGGVQVANTGVRNHGTVDDRDDEARKSFYNVHWYIYPVLYWLEVLVDFMCLESTAMDLAYMTELDPFWADDEKSAILNPEGILFGNPIAQAACAGDCVTASVYLPIDGLFWCGGCQGSLYPFTGTVTSHNGGIQASLILVSRMIAKLHREGLLQCTSGQSALCGKHLLPIIKKSQYRTQMTFPVSQSRSCQALGATEVTWQAGREYPFQGEDYGYLIWRKRDCCVG